MIFHYKQSTDVCRDRTVLVSPQGFFSGHKSRAAPSFREVWLQSPSSDLRLGNLVNSLQPNYLSYDDCNVPSKYDMSSLREGVRSRTVHWLYVELAPTTAFGVGSIEEAVHGEVFNLCALQWSSENQKRVPEWSSQGEQSFISHSCIGSSEISFR